LADLLPEAREAIDKIIAFAKPKIAARAPGA
jgi:hypothetical protein